ncbi:MAG: AraC-like DNA-binding protein [Lentisphaeria bacterium]
MIFFYSPLSLIRTIFTPILLGFLMSGSHVLISNTSRLKAYQLQRALNDQLADTALPEYAGLTQAVQRALCSRVLGSAFLSSVSVAGDLDLTPRTLVRRLALERTKFEVILLEVQRHFALRMLVDTGMSIRKISLVLGFKNVTSFSSTFDGWTGLSPEAFKYLYRTRTNIVVRST